MRAHAIPLQAIVNIKEYLEGAVCEYKLSELNVDCLISSYSFNIGLLLNSVVKEEGLNGERSPAWHKVYTYKESLDWKHARLGVRVCCECRATLFISAWKCQ